MLQSRARDEYEMPGVAQVARVAMQLANSGSIPGLGEHGRKSEFIKRCATALQALDLSKETDLKKLTAEEQAIVRRVLGGDTSVPYEGCLSQGCLDEKTTWVVSNAAVGGQPFEPLSRCSRCKLPKAFGRTVHGLGDILKQATHRTQGRRHRTSALPL